MLRIVPDFNEADRLAHPGDRVELRVLIDVDGSVERVLVREGIPGTTLIKKIVDAVTSTRYRPATQDGTPVRAWTTESFSLRYQPEED
jgi:hypothetical protein